MNEIKDKIAIIGFGASGFGTYLGLKEKGFKNIYIYDQGPLYKKTEINEWNNKNLKENYKYLKNKLGLIDTANTKTYFGNTLNSIGFGNFKLYDNQIGGGLLNFWGGVLQTFDQNTLSSCLEVNDLNEYYLKVSKKIPITQIICQKSEKSLYANQQNIRCQSYVEEIDEGINKHSSEIIKKNTILAISENKNHKNCHCVIGCLKHKFFNTNNLKTDNDLNFINEEVKKIDFDKNLIISNKSTQAFDKIFLNAGPYYDQKILIDSSENTKNSIRVKDSSSFIFPIFFKGKLNENKADFGLTNYIIGIKDKDVNLGHAQIYPPLDHINKAIFPYYFWDKLDFLKNISVNRLLWARCYLNDEYSNIKEFKNDKHIQIFKNNKIKKIQKKFFQIIKKNIQNSNIYPINFLINSNTSAHYAGDFDYIKKNILKQSEDHFNKKIIFNDSLLWKKLPSESPTFTIMANALRNTDLYL